MRTYTCVAALLDALARAGVRHVVASPGSRSTPLVLCADSHRAFDVHVRVDERSAAYFALGQALGSGRPTLLICTSGTAAANYLPAVTEAHNARVPLVVATADRPARLRASGANQTIDQHRLYGTHVRRFDEVQLPLTLPLDEAARYVARVGSRAVAAAVGPVAGPVHVNVGFEEPLTPPDGGVPSVTTDGVEATASARHNSADTLARLREALFVGGAPAGDEITGGETTGGVVVAGPMPPTAASDQLVDALRAFCAATGWPLLAEATSQLRRSAVELADVSVFTAFEQLLSSPLARAAAGEAAPGAVLRVGAPPTSAALRAWLARSTPQHVLLGPGAGFDDPTFTATHAFDCPVAVLADLALSATDDDLAHIDAAVSKWRARLATTHDELCAAIAKLLDAGSRAQLSGLSVAAAVLHHLGRDDALFCSNSMPVRDVETVMPLGVDNPVVYANRGTSGIDGVLSTAAGIAHVSHPTGSRNTTVLMGDLAFRHGIGCLAGLYDTAPPARLSVVVVDDGGGGIFRRLAVAQRLEAEQFERLFVTPIKGRAADVAAALSGVFGFGHAHAATAGELSDALGNALCDSPSDGPPRDGPAVSVITTEVDPTFDAEVRARVADAADASLRAGLS